MSAEIIKLLERPLVVAPVNNGGDLASLASLDLDATCDVIELRLDGLLDHLDAIAPAIEDISCPIIITARHPLEGGAGELSGPQRSGLLSRFFPLATWIDVEVRSLTSLSGVIDRARERDIGLIASFHDFQACPSLETLNRTILDGYCVEADVIKIAVHLETRDELIGLRSFFVSHPHLKLSLMGMGPLGKDSRVELARAGSVLNYGYLTEPNAPGQWPAAELKALIAEF